jgi:siderophore synthetase component
VRLVWVAALASRCSVASVEGVGYEALLQSELGSTTLDGFKAVLRARGLSPSAYVMIPVHPWQWNNRVAQLFAADIACEDLVLLGEGSDQYQPQQSIRTAFNVSSPEKHYVKTALSILNMGFTRGMSPGIAKGVAAVNAWVEQLVSADAVLRALGFEVLREVAFVGYRHRYFEQTSSRRYDPYRETLAALWRESPITRIKTGERLMTMAALLHVDADGTSLLAELINASGLPAAAWLRAYLRAYLTPLLHCFYAYQLTFTPHCENVILVLEDSTPKRMLMKDIAEDIGVLNPTFELPEGVKHLALRVPEEVMTLVIFTDAFDCVFRFLGQIVEEHGICGEGTLWREVAECVLSYERQHPEHSEKFARYNLFADTFLRNCLNRLQLKNNRLMVDLNAAEPGDSLQFVGTLPNPIAGFSPRRARQGVRS